MGFLFSGIFWGTILILLGISIILKALFHIDLPLVRLVFAIIIIYFGISVLVGRSIFKTSERVVMFGESRIEAVDDRDDLSVIFGKGVIDAGMPLTQKNKHIKINTVFGHSTVYINAAVPTLVRVDAAFGGVRTPDNTTTSFGSAHYRTKAFSDTADYRIVEIDCVFGGCDIVEKAEESVTTKY